MKLNKILVATLWGTWFTSGVALAQNVVGRVCNEIGEPLQGVVISVPGAIGYFTTDVDGKFMIELPENTTEFTCRYIGYKDKKVNSRGEFMEISLKEDISLSDELMNVAMDKTEKRLGCTGAISTVKSDVIANTPTIGLDQALQGHLAGLIQTQGGSQGGYDGTTHYIRGLNSEKGNALLIVLDGVPAPTLDLNSLDPNTIESVSILKDAASKALYGPQGAQGVILVQTKRGKVGKTQVHVNMNFALQNSVNRFETRDSYSYANLRNEALKNDGLKPVYSSNDLQAFSDGTGINNKWSDMFLNKTVSVQNYSVDVSGGNSRVQYFVNAGFVHQGGIYDYEEAEKYNLGQYYNRFSVTSNVNVNMFKYLKAFISTNVRIHQQNETIYGTSKVINDVMNLPPTLEGPTTEDGKVLTNEFFSNPVYGSINLRGAARTTSTDINGTFGLNLNLSFLTPGLSARALVGYHSYYTGVLRRNRDYTRYMYNDAGELVTVGSNVDTPVSMEKNANTLYFMNLQGFVDYDRSFGKHCVNAMLNYFAEDRISGNGTAEWMLPYKRIALNGHVKYGYDDRYFIQADFNDTGSEQFKKGHQFHFSPTVSAAWVASNEGFLKDADWLTLLKFRASYGELTYDNLYEMDGRLLHTNKIQQKFGDGLVGSLYNYALVKELNIGNPDITWETSKQFNIGVDLSLFNSLSLSVDYWKTKQEEMLIQNELVPSCFGKPSIPYENLGKMENQGVEVEANYKKKFNCGLDMTLFANYSYNKNEVVDVNELDRSGSGFAYSYRRTGYGLGQSFGYLIDYSNGNGYFNTQEEIDKYGLEYSGMAAPRVGDFIYQDLNSDGVINEADKAPLEGTKTVPSHFYGMGTSLKYKDFDLYLFFQGVGGYSRVYSGLGVYENQSQGVYSEMHENAWTEERWKAGQSIEYPALTSTNSSSLQNNAFFTSKSNYFRLKNLVFGYTVPRQITRKAHIEKLRIFFSGENLLSHSNLKFKNIDAEKGTLDGYPLYRTFNLGLNINF